MVEMLPVRKQGKLTRKISTCVTEDVFKFLEDLKEKGFDVPEFIRNSINKGIKEVKEKHESSTIQ